MSVLQAPALPQAVQPRPVVLEQLAEALPKVLGPGRVALPERETPEYPASVRSTYQRHTYLFSRFAYDGISTAR